MISHPISNGSFYYQVYKGEQPYGEFLCMQAVRR